MHTLSPLVTLLGHNAQPHARRGEHEMPRLACNKDTKSFLKNATQLFIIDQMLKSWGPMHGSNLEGWCEIEYSRRSGNFRVKKLLYDKFLYKKFS